VFLVVLLVLFPVRLSDALTEVREGGDTNGEFRESPTQLALRSVGLERLVYLPFNESSQTVRLCPRLLVQMFLYNAQYAVHSDTSASTE
jgi:hypothetical protein